MLRAARGAGLDEDCTRYVSQMRSIGEAIRRLCAERPEDEETVATIEREVLAGVAGGEDDG